MPVRAPGKVSVEDIDIGKLLALLGRLERGEESLDAGSAKNLRDALLTLEWLQAELARDKVQLARLKKQLFGSTSEKTSQLLGRSPETRGDQPASSESPSEDGAPKEDQESGKQRKKKKGHGRNGADAYTGAERIEVPHPTLTPGDPCPLCPKGRVYPVPPRLIVRLTGQAPVGATIFEQQGLRCNLCGEVFRGPPPEGCGHAKYDAKAKATILLNKYGLGNPFHRLERFQEALGVPLPAATQWDLVAQASVRLAPAFEEMVRQAAQGEILHLDDTNMPILSFMKENARLAAQDGGSKKRRTGMFSTGIVSIAGGRQIALFLTGRQHAGENLAKLLEQRAKELDPPIQMCDAAQRNLVGDLATVLGFCLPHGRRYFVDLHQIFPQETCHVLEELGKVFHHDALARNRKMSDQERLSFHQEHSGPVMEELRTWMQGQLDEKRVEPNSALGKAFAYMFNHWEGLTLFLRKAGAPLSNNICERALKRVVLHRKNALFFKTENGARVGDIAMTLIHTALLSAANPFDYLVALLENPDELAADPASWMPWSYQATRQNLAEPLPGAA